MTRERLTGTAPLRGGGERRRLVGGLRRPVPAASRPPLLRAVLVPVDGSPAAEHALPHALALAHRDGAEVTLVGVYSTLQAAGDPARLGWHDGEYRVEPLRDYLDDLARRVAGAGPVGVRPLLLRGRRPEDVLCATGDRQADLVVMAARRRGWWSRLLHGSVSDNIARRSRSPVLLVPAEDGRADLTARPPLGRVLVLLDGTTGAEGRSATRPRSPTGGASCSASYARRPRWRRGPRPGISAGSPADCAPWACRFDGR